MSTTDSNHINRSACQKFNIQDISPGTTTFICGKKLTGKSTVLVTLTQRRHDAQVVIFSSEYVASSYRKYFPEEAIYEKYDPHVMKKLIESQQANCGRKELLVAIDDVAVNKDIWQDRYIRDIVRYGSSLNITTLFSIQYAGQLEDVFKRNVDYVFVFHDHILENQKLLYKEFGGMFLTFTEFKTVLDECIQEPYRCLVFDLKTPRKDPRHGVFWYKAPPLQAKSLPSPKKPWIRRLIDWIQSYI